MPFSVAGRPVTLQVGWRRLYQLASRIEGDTRRVPVSSSSRPESVIRIDSATDGSIDLWSLAGAVRFTSRLALGWSVDLYRGDWEDRANTSEDPGVLGPTDFASVRISNRVSGNGLNLGLLLTYPSLRLGVVYHGALDSDYWVTQASRSSLTEPFDGSYGPVALHFPRSIGVGAAWRPKPLLQLALDVTYDEWTQFLVDSTPGGAVSGFDNLPPELSATRDTFTVNAGLEKLFPVSGKVVPLRLGVSREPQGARDPLLRDGLDYPILAAGTGLNTNSVKLDIAVEYRWGSYSNSTNLSPVYRVGRAEELRAPSAAGGPGRHEPPGMAAQGLGDLPCHRHREAEGRSQEGLRFLTTDQVDLPLARPAVVARDDADGRSRWPWRSCGLDGSGRGWRLWLPRWRLSRTRRRPNLDGVGRERHRPRRRR